MLNFYTTHIPLLPTVFASTRIATVLITLIISNQKNKNEKTTNSYDFDFNNKTNQHKKNNLRNNK